MAAASSNQTSCAASAADFPLDSTMTQPDTLLSALQHADMLEIDGLHAWHFDLDTAQLTSAAEGPFLSIECMDGRALRKWHFRLSEVQAARYQAEDDAWALQSQGNAHCIKCFAAISGDNQDDSDAPANDE